MGKFFAPLFRGISGNLVGNSSWRNLYFSRVYVASWLLCMCKSRWSAETTCFACFPAAAVESEARCEFLTDDRSICFNHSGARRTGARALRPESSGARSTGARISGKFLECGARSTGARVRGKFLDSGARSTGARVCCFARGARKSGAREKPLRRFRGIRGILCLPREPHSQGEGEVALAESGVGEAARGASAASD